MLAPKKNAFDARSIIFLPQISLNFVQIGPAAAFAIRYAPPIHVYPEADFKSDVIVGTAVAMMVWSRAATKSPM